MTDIEAIASQFQTTSPVVQVKPFGNGLINSTFLVETQSGRRYLMQRINDQVFHQPVELLHNLATFFRRLHDEPTAKQFTLQFPTLIATQDNQPFYHPAPHEFWRMMTFIENTCSYDTLTEMQAPQQAAMQLGQALGLFHRIGATMPIDLFHDTLPGFHIAPNYLQQYHSLSSSVSPIADSAEDRFCQRTIDQFEDQFKVLEQGKTSGILREAVIHGDPKLNNFLFYCDRLEVASLIDLDTLKPGLWHYDLGDALRSLCNLQGENPASDATIGFDFQIAIWTKRNIFLAWLIMIISIQQYYCCHLSSALDFIPITWRAIAILKSIIQTKTVNALKRNSNWRTPLQLNKTS